MPPSNIDLKRVVKQTFSHPNGINRPYLPSTAKVVGIAKGNEGNRTGVHGYSERASAIYGESPVIAGVFKVMSISTVA
jgi:hypothetical protein